MGRPLNKKYFGNTGAQGGTGGEGVASVTIGGSWANFADATTTVVFGLPNIAGGTQAQGTAVIVGGAVTAVTITEPGSGYTSVPSVTITDSDGGGETTGTATAVLTTTRQNAITVQGITAGSTNRTSGNDVVKQVSTRRFKITTTDGTAICELKASAPTTAGEMAIVATDSAGGTYYVTKLTSRKATLTQGTGSQFTTGTAVPWNLDAAVENVSVLIPNA